jgi:hypothetical protein
MALRRGEKSREEFFRFGRMTMQDTWTKQGIVLDGQQLACRILQPQYIEMIDEALCALGDYGEVRLVVERGRLRFLVTQKSYDLLKRRPGETIRTLEP